MLLTAVVVAVIVAVAGFLPVLSILLRRCAKSDEMKSELHCVNEAFSF